MYVLLRSTSSASFSPHYGCVAEVLCEISLHDTFIHWVRPGCYLSGIAGTSLSNTFRVRIMELSIFVRCLIRGYERKIVLCRCLR